MDEGADVNAQGNDGATSLIAASQWGHPEIAQLLIKEGADVNAQAKNGQTVLMSASQWGHPEVL